MKVTREKTENHQAYLTIELEPEEMKESLQASYRRLANRANIPGFRKGKAPQPVLERYLGKERILEDAVSHSIPHVYEDALKEEGIESIAEPEIQITQTEPLIFKATVPLVPVVEIGDYKSVKLAPDKVEVTDADINSAIEAIRHQYATWEPVERPVNFGDLIVLNIESHVEEKPFINQGGAQYQVIKDSANPVKGFAEQLMGLKQGEEKDFTIKLPDDFSRKELAGKEASFKVTISEVKEEKLPELDDKLAKQVDPEFKTIDQLRERVTANLKMRAAQKERADFAEKVVDAVVSQAKVEYPPVMVEAEIDSLLNEQTRRLQMVGLDLDEYLKNIKKDEKEIREQLRPLATKRIVRQLVLNKIAEEEKIEATETEVDADIEQMLASAASKKSEMEKLLGSPRARQSIREYILNRKSIERLVGLAEVKSEPEVKESEKGGEQ